MNGGSPLISSTTSTTSGVPAMSSPKGQCPDLSRSLSLGSNGPDVSGLQLFLAQEGLFKGIATGYFGSLTESAVQQWQLQNGIVTSGDSNSTGFGLVGPRTRTAMESSCSPVTGTNAQCLPVQPPILDCPSSWQPVVDASGCTAYYKCSIALPTPSSASSSATSSASLTPTSCPVVQKPTCSGTVTPFQTSSNGCVVSYQCSF
jgi:hypothetical protein